MSNFQPPPTWANPVIVDEATGRSTFNPIWLKWFIELSANLGGQGAGSGTVIGHTPVTLGHMAAWFDSAAVNIGDGGVIGSAAHAAVTDFVSATGTHDIVGLNIQATTNFKSSDGSAGYTGSVTTASLVGKTITIKNGIITGVT